MSFFLRKILVIASYLFTELLDRVEQSRTNDVSETSTVTEEYATATENNSATPSGRASLTGPVSSVESASSKHSLSHDDGFKDQQQVCIITMPSP